ncbi:hypothetical protein AKJ63_01170 [candidate division MSBL1 archaeon SCGC-AAA259D18]|uniref:Molybdate/tungstate import ATP-binding protein WtpC n=1 Tax=candidate division MSBL1 archaeon SCGC-AAA259D18 TaxID=1698262 RepID=A0A133UBR6_9EURY|nr:hypothetical protein AKJ63_01170 [candidate division MSBL1 archaeon SCGC-AAA259D18]
MISIENLSRDWPDFSLQNINLEVKDREYFVILGPTAAGKTLLLELIAGFYKPEGDQIRISGEDVTMKDPEERSVGFVYQDYSLFPHLTVEENIKFGLQVNSFLKEEVIDKTQQIMDLFGISHLTDRYPRTLSGGEQQKTALARGLVLDPKVLLLDEPISSLDMPSQEEMRRELRRIHEETEVTTLHVTHNREEASWLGDRIAVMNHGEIVQVGNPDEVFRKPKSEFVANFVGIENIFEGKSKREGSVAKIDIGSNVQIEATTEREGDVKICIRPEDILISKQPIKTSGRNMMDGQIVNISNLDNISRVTVDVGKEFAVVITKRSLFDMDLEVGKNVYITFKASSVHVV